MRRMGRVERGLLLVILCLAAVLRFAGLAQIPPGIEHDEVAEVLIAQQILEGHHALFFREAYGQEPLFLYLLAGALALFGEHVLALRFVSASVGLLTVAAGTRLARRLFGSRVALVTAAGLAVMVWPVFWSRVGLRGMTLPLILCLAADALWHVLHTAMHASPSSPSRAERAKAEGAKMEHAKTESGAESGLQPGGGGGGGGRPYKFVLLSGLFFGLSAYTYLAARGLPIMLLVFLLYLGLFNRALLRQSWRPLALILLLALVVALPLTLYVLQHPDVQYRVYEVNAPLMALREGNPQPVLENLLRVLGMFSVRGDFTVRNNVPDRPVFPEVLWALLFYVGLLLSIARLRDPRYAFVLIWLGVMLSPSVVTTEAPNFVRTLGALPVVMLLPGVGAVEAAKYLVDRWPFASASRWLWGGVLLILIFLNAGLTVRDYFGRWPAIEETQFVWQTDLAAVAQTLDANPQFRDVGVAGLSNATMDAPTLALLMRREDVRLRWMDTGSPLGAGGALVIPGGGGWLFVPRIVPLNAILGRQLEALGAHAQVAARDTQLYQLPDDAGAGRVLATFAANVQLLDVQYVEPAATAPEGMLALLTVWRAGERPYPPLKAFVHLVDASGNLLTQHDGLDSPSRFWYPGDIIMQVHILTLPSDVQISKDDYALRVGLYNRETLEPYRLLDGRDFWLGGVETGR